MTPRFTREAAGPRVRTENSAITIHRPQGERSAARGRGALATTKAVLRGPSGEDAPDNLVAALLRWEDAFVSVLDSTRRFTTKPDGKRPSFNGGELSQRRETAALWRAPTSLTRCIISLILLCVQQERLLEAL